MELWYIARFDIESSLYYLQRLSSNSEMYIYHWISNRYRAMFFYSELSLGGYINTYMSIPRENIKMRIICFKNGEENKSIPFLEFNKNYTNILHNIIST